MRKRSNCHNSHRFVTPICDNTTQYQTELEVDVTKVTALYKNIKYLLLLYRDRVTKGPQKTCDFVTFVVTLWYSYRLCLQNLCDNVTLIVTNYKTPVTS